MRQPFLAKFGLQCRQYLGGMLRRLGDTAPVLSHLAVRPYPHGGPDDAHGSLAVHLFFAESLIFFHHFFFRVAQQWKRNFERRRKFRVRGFIVGGNSHDSRIEFLEFAVNVTESLGFFGSPGGVVLGIEVDDEVFPLEIL